MNKKTNMVLFKVETEFDCSTLDMKHYISDMETRLKWDQNIDKLEGVLELPLDTRIIYAKMKS